MLYLFSFPPTLTMMHLCIIQCTCWTPLTRFYLCTLACPATMNTLTTHLRWGEGKLSTVQLPLCAEVKKMKSLQTLHIRGCLPCQLKGLLFSVVGEGEGKIRPWPPIQFGYRLNLLIQRINKREILYSGKHIKLPPAECLDPPLALLCSSAFSVACRGVCGWCDDPGHPTSMGHPTTEFCKSNSVKYVI